MTSLRGDEATGRSVQDAPLRQGAASEQAGERLGTNAALAVTAVLATAIGLATAGGLWISTNGLRAQAEQSGRLAALTAASGFTTLEAVSAANIARTLDVVLDDQLRALAGATALLVEAAESAGHPPAYIEDALRQIAYRSAILRIDVSAGERQGYSTEARPLRTEELEQAFQVLATAAPEGRTLVAAAQQTPDGLTKAAAAQTMHRRLAVRVEQALDDEGAKRTYGQTGNRAAQELAEQQAAGIALMLSHAIELAEDAGWGGRRIRERLEAMVRNTTVERIEALGAGGPAVYEAGGADAGAPGRSAADLEKLEVLRKAQQTMSLALDGRYDRQRRWIAAAGASRGRGRLAAIVELATRAGRGSLVESAWQAEADRLAQVSGVTGVWVAVVDDDSIRLAAAAPRPGQGAEGSQDAWSRWNDRLAGTARSAAGERRPRSRAAITLLDDETASVLSAAPTGGRQGPAVVVVVENRADEVVRQMRREVGIGLGAAVGLMAVMALATTWAVRRWLTTPVVAVAEGAQSLAEGRRPAGLAGSIRHRGDEIGTLGRSFEQMTEQVLARHDELQARVAERTRWLRSSNEQLTLAQERMQQDVSLAKVVQTALVPTGTQRVGTLELCARMTPAKDLGGDFVIVQKRESDELVIAVCDVSGKGVAAALFMASAQGVLSAAARQHDSVCEIAEEANRRLCEGNELCMFVTGLIAAVDTQTGVLEYVCAGHEPAIVVDAESRLARLPATGGLPLGLEASERFQKREYRIGAGQSLVMYTDGVTDACNPGVEMFGEERLQELVRSSRLEKAAGIVQTIWTGIDLFSGPAAVVDDKTCLVVQRQG